MNLATKKGSGLKHMRLLHCKENQLIQNMHLPNIYDGCKHFQQSQILQKFLRQQFYTETSNTHECH